MSTIHDIPLDVWSTILLHINPQDLVATYEVLFQSHALNIKQDEKLTTFWILMSLARINMRQSDDAFENIPDGQIYQESVETLREMGVPIDTAREVVGHARGNLSRAFEMLGWN